MALRALSVASLHTGSRTYPNKTHLSGTKQKLRRKSRRSQTQSDFFAELQNVSESLSVSAFGGTLPLGMPVTSLDLKSLKALQGEPPKTQIALVRIAWPEIKLALAQGHSLRVVHERLLEAHILIKYPLLSQYIRRLRREEQSADQIAGVVGAKIAAAGAGPTEPLRATVAHMSTPVNANQPDSKHPLADFEERVGKVKTFKFKPGLPDESKLI